MRSLTVLTLTALLAAPHALARNVTLAAVTLAAVPCTLAEKLDLSTFRLYGGYGDSELDWDTASADYADCRAKALTRDLAKMPQLSARLSTLRTLYRQLNAADGDLAYQMQGGGTMYTHGIPRSYPDIETTLDALAALAGSRYGAVTGPRFAQSIQASKQALGARLSLLKGWQPDKDENATFDPAQFKASLATYEHAANAIQKLLGAQNDAATAAGYLPLGRSLFLDDALNSND